MEDFAREIRALHETTLEMHSENRRAAEKRQVEFERGLAAIATSLHALELTVTTGHSALHERIALHEASPHHAGTLERLMQHETRMGGHEARLDGHDTALGQIREWLRGADGRRAAESEGRSHHYAKWGVLGTLLVGGGAIIATVGTAILNAWASLTASGHPPVK